MASGIEVVGVVLTVVPIVIKAAKSCADGVDDAKQILRTKHSDEVKSDLFDVLYQELVLFHRHVRKVLESLPDISEDRCNQLLNLASTEGGEWQSESDVVKALQSYLGLDYEAFDHTIREVNYWIDGILDDKFIKSQGPTESDFTTRLDLWRKNGKLKDQIKSFKRWRKFVEKITENKQCRQYSQTTIEGEKTECQRPSCVVPRLSRGLYRGLAESWRCKQGCPDTHTAKICLQLGNDLHKRPDPESVKYNLLLSMPHRDPASTEWRESSVTVKCLAKRRHVSFQQTKSQAPIADLCTTMLSHDSRRGNKLCFVADHFEDDGTTSVYKAKDYLKSNFDIDLKQASTVQTFADILSSFMTQLNLTQKRQLALTMAYGMLILAGSPWLDDRWSKAQIYFFNNKSNNICHAQPFVSSDMTRLFDYVNPLSQDVWHPLPPVLCLGIILLELETGETIESMRTDDDYLDPITKEIDENTDFAVAFREAEARAMTSPLYKEAILACLEQEWDDTGTSEEPNITQEHVRKRIYEQIVQKLETDLDALLA